MVMYKGLWPTLRALQWKPVACIADVKRVTLSLSSSARAEAIAPLAANNAAPARSVPRRFIFVYFQLSSRPFVFISTCQRTDGALSVAGSAIVRKEDAIGRTPKA